MIVQPSLEQEFKLESEATAIKEDDHHQEIAELCATLSKQNWYQQQLIKQATAHIMELESKITCLEFIEKLVMEDERPWWKKIFRKGSVFSP